VIEHYSQYRAAARPPTTTSFVSRKRETSQGQARPAPISRANSRGPRADHPSIGTPDRGQGGTNQNPPSLVLFIIEFLVSDVIVEVLQFIFNHLVIDKELRN
jgi:hypothetical protein